MSSRAGRTLSADHPFPGLRPFEAADRAFFFGRRKHVLDIYALLDLSRFIAVIGSSGSGKSSLVRAGLLPLLEDEKTWHTVTLHPGDHPMAELTDALAGLALRVEGDEDETHRDIRKRRVELALQKSSFGISAALDEMPKLKDTSVLLVVDQFEELFRYTAASASTKKRVADTLWRDEASFFVQSLLEATRMANRNVCVLITMRSDFIGDCARYNGLPEAVSAAQFLVPSLTRDQREEVIREPIKKAKATIDPELVERLLIDIEPELDQLPVLSHCLAQMWSRAKNKHLTLDDYEKVGGLKGALSQHATKVLESKELAGLITGVELAFRALSERDKEGRATRRALVFERLQAETGLAREDLVKIIDRFRAEDCSFILPSATAVATLRDDTRIDVVHEALLRRWDKISAEDKGWLAKEEADGRFYRGLLAMLEGVGASARVTLPLDQVEDRWNRWQSLPRTAAWAERYGGHFERVEQLLADSRAALAQAREAERQRIEAEEKQKRERLELETRLAQQQAKAAKALAQRTRVLATVMSAIAVLAVLAAIYGVSSSIRARAAEAKANQEASAANYEAIVAQQSTIMAKIDQQNAVISAHNASIAAHDESVAATEASQQATIAQRETVVAQTAQGAERAAATKFANMSNSLSLIAIDHSMYSTGNYDNRVAGLIGTDAYASAASVGATRDVLLTAAWTPNALARVALPAWTLGGVVDRGQYIAVLSGQRQEHYGQQVSGSLVAVDATTFAVLSRTPGVRGSLMCGFDDADRVAIAQQSGIALYALDYAGRSSNDASIPSGPVSALACLSQGRVAYVDSRGLLRVADAHSATTIGRVDGTANGIALSNSSRLAAVTTTSGVVDIYNLGSHRLLSSEQRLTSSADCSGVVGCGGAVAFNDDESQIAWYDAGAVHMGPVTSSTDASYTCPTTICSAASLVYFAPGTSIPAVVASGGVLYYDSTNKTYATSYNDSAGGQRRPILDREFGMYVTPYDPNVAAQPNPFSSGLAAHSFSRIDFPLLGTIPASQWIGSYGLRGNSLFIPAATGYQNFDLDRLRSGFENNYSFSYHVRMYDSGDGRHAVAFNMFTGDVDVMDITGEPTSIYHFKVPAVPVKANHYEYFVEPAYDPQSGTVTLLSYCASGSSGCTSTFATLRRYSAASGALLTTENGAQLLRHVGVPLSKVNGWEVTARGTYAIVKVAAPASDAVIRWNGDLIGRAFSVDYISPKETMAIASIHSGRGYNEEAFSLPSWTQRSFLGIPWSSIGMGISPDGSTLAYYDEDQNNNNRYELRLYDVATYEAYTVALPSPPDLASYAAVTFSADGRYLIATYLTPDNYRRLAIYTVNPETWARAACLMAGRSLSAREFRLYAGSRIPYRDGCAPYADQMYRW